MKNNKELLGLVEDVKNICIGMATGGDFSYEKYEEAREKMLSRSELKSALPDWLIDHRYGSEFWRFIKNKFAHYQERREFLRASFDELSDYVNKGGSLPVALSIRVLLGSLNSEELNRLWRKSLERIQHDPEGAITAARSLLEATMKYILDKEDEDYKNNDDMNDLFRKVKKVLGLDPANHNIQTFKQILSGVTAVVSGFSSLRNEYGDAHGRGAESYIPEMRHAELVINLSGSLCSFLIDSYQNKQKYHDASI